MSGGQTGADRAGLDWAIENGVPHGGFCPKGRVAEDGVIPEKYLLKELGTSSYPERTRRNARESDGTIIFTLGPELKGGSKLTAKCATEFGKPCLHVWRSAPQQVTGAAVRAFVEDHRIRILNIAGSRGSQAPEIGSFVKAVLDTSLRNDIPVRGQAL